MFLRPLSIYDYFFLENCLLKNPIYLNECKSCNFKVDRFKRLSQQEKEELVHFAKIKITKLEALSSLYKHNDPTILHYWKNSFWGKWSKKEIQKLKFNIDIRYYTEFQLERLTLETIQNIYSINSFLGIKIILMKFFLDLKNGYLKYNFQFLQKIKKESPVLLLALNNKKYYNFLLKKEFSKNKIKNLYLLIQSLLDLDSFNNTLKENSHIFDLLYAQEHWISLNDLLKNNNYLQNISQHSISEVIDYINKTIKVYEKLEKKRPFLFFQPEHITTKKKNKLSYYEINWFKKNYTLLLNHLQPIHEKNLLLPKNCTISNKTQIL